MKILLFAATATELAPLLSAKGVTNGDSFFRVGKHEVNVLIGGVGMVSTAYSLGEHLSKNTYTLAINAGIAGALDTHIPLGKVLQITDDTIADFGAESPEGFIFIDQLGYGSQTFRPIAPGIGFQTLDRLPKASALTVNKSHGTETSIADCKNRYAAQVESMEGAAFFYACERAQLPSIQLRAISNWVEPRNRDAWDIPGAIASLNSVLVALLEE